MTYSELAARISALEDIKAIKSTHKEFVYLLMNSQLEEMLDYFADDAVVEMRSSGPCKGKEEVTQLLKQEITDLNNLTNIYMLIQPVINASGDTAKGHWIMDYFTKDPNTPLGPSPIYMPGRHDCEYTRVNGEWKFSYLRWTCPWPKHAVKQ